MAHEYGGGLREFFRLMDELPLAQAFILNGIVAERYGMVPRGPTFDEKRQLAAMRAAKDQNPTN